MTIHFTIAPGMGNKLSSWQKYAQSQSEEKNEAGNCITISREFGCQSYPVAEALEKRFNAENTKSPWVVLDRKLMEKIAEESGHSTAELEQASDADSGWSSMFSMFTGQHKVGQSELFADIKKAVIHFANIGRCIIVGRGAVAFTQNFTNCIHIRLVAPLEFRIKNIMESMGKDEKEAQQYIDSHQRQRDAFIHHFTDMFLGDPTLYHLVINNERHSPDEIAEIIEFYLKLRQKT